MRAHVAARSRAPAFSVKKRSIPIILSATVGFAILVFALSFVEVSENTRLFSSLDAPFHDRLFRVRNAVSDQPISSDVVLLGIDDESARNIGKFGQGEWKVRRPFREQLPYMREVFKPKVIAYDILFKRDQEEAFDVDGMVVSDPEKLQRIHRFFGNLLSGDVEQDESRDVISEVLVDINRMSAEQGNMELAHELLKFQDMEPDVRPAPIIAFAFREGESATEPLPEGQVDPNAWTDTDILGPDPDWQDEDQGMSVPYLRDVSVPWRYIYGDTSHFEVSTIKVDLPTYHFLDVSQLAHINVPRDPDGMPRWYPLIKGMGYSFTDPKTDEKVTRRFAVPSLAFLSVLRFWGIDPYELHVNDAWEVDGKPVIEIHLGDYVLVRRSSGEERRIPIDDQGRMFINYVGRTRDFTGVPFYKLTDKWMNESRTEDGGYTLDPALYGALNRKMVFVGMMETGATDVGPTPVEEYTGYVTVHMLAASNMLENTFIRPLWFGDLWVLLVLVALVTPAAVFMPPRRFSVVQVGIVGVYALVLYLGVHFSAFLLPIFTPLLFLTLSYFTVVLYFYWTEEREKRVIRGMFATMVSQEVLQFMEENPDSFSLAGQQAHATMFFSDVAGFTNISEGLPPEELVTLLNRYLTPMTDIIQESKGYVDKYEGDAIMAEWGVPFPNADHARLGCWSALDQQAKLAELRPEFKRDFGVDLTVRMGLNSGIVSAGHMGSEHRKSYTVMGDAVNQAARFEPVNKDYDTDIVIGESTYQLARDYIETRLLDRIIVKGKTIPIKIYELIAKKGEMEMDMREVVTLYEEALAHHWERRWDEADKCLDEALEIRPEDGPCKTLQARIRLFRESPPSDTWQGEYVRASKD